jgi:hypothetical protein
MKNVLVRFLERKKLESLPLIRISHNTSVYYYLLY